MDRHQLCEALRAAGVPDAHYEIPGCLGGQPSLEGYYLAHREGQWIVGVHERGRREVLETFADESRACAWLYERLTDETSPPVRPTAAEMDEMLHDSEGIERRAQEQLEQALAKSRREARGGPPNGGPPNDGH
ncbi:hypothetical protein ACFC4G_36875 [Streptomyces sp. NPDC056002]|uniref:hypothetical protein n=1 Tax=Streptomyces sp. NPDC056002 TaxID=3345675 RepID=UPI0035DBE72E